MQPEINRVRRRRSGLPCNFKRALDDTRLFENDLSMANEVVLTALTKRESEEVSELTRAIEEWFRESADRVQFRVDLDACIPAIGDRVAERVVEWAEAIIYSVESDEPEPSSG